MSDAHLKDKLTLELMAKLMSNAQLLVMFPNLQKLAAIGLIISMSFADCESGFFALGRIKTDLHKTKFLSIECSYDYFV